MICQTNSANIVIVSNQLAAATNTLTIQAATNAANIFANSNTVALLTNMCYYFTNVQTLAFSGAGNTNVIVDFSLAARFSLNITTNTYFGQPLNVAPLRDFTIKLTQGTNAFVVNWNTNYWRFQNNVILTMATNTGAICFVNGVQNTTNVCAVQNESF
jgi:hypothetical protein